jgi:hypothetical protein
MQSILVRVLDVAVHLGCFANKSAFTFRPTRKRERKKEKNRDTHPVQGQVRGQTQLATCS